MITPKNEPVKRHGPWRNNAEMIHDVHRVHPLIEPVLDTTHGEFGGFWKVYRPTQLIAVTLSTNWDLVADYTALPFADQSVPTVVFDPQYKLSGTPAMDYDERYGIHIAQHWTERLKQIEDGARECARVAGHMLLVKCQDQVCNNKIRWQTDIVTKAVEGQGLRKADRFELSSYRAQPPKGQKHARSDTSQLLVFLRD